jgi:serine/threonine protein phosphatase 1
LIPHPPIAQTGNRFQESVSARVRRRFSVQPLFMRTLAIGDIHGCSAALDHLLTMVRPGKTDTVITMGDYVDRGPDSRGVVERMLLLKKNCVLVPLKGNHEVMMLESRTDSTWDREWRRHGGEQTLASYARGRETPTLKAIPPEHWQFLEHECLDYWETDTHIFVHANLAPDLPLNQQQTLFLFWEFLTDQPQPHMSGKTMICGHTSLRSGFPLHLGHTICIDTYAYGGGFLTCLDVGSNVIYQASQSGMKREMLLRRPV